jgi:hypothetical protein
MRVCVRELRNCWQGESEGVFVHVSLLVCVRVNMWTGVGRDREKRTERRRDRRAWGGGVGGG